MIRAVELEQSVVDTLRGKDKPIPSYEVILHSEYHSETHTNRYGSEEEGTTDRIVEVVVDASGAIGVGRVINRHWSSELGRTWETKFRGWERNYELRLTRQKLQDALADASALQLTS